MSAFVRGMIAGARLRGQVGDVVAKGGAAGVEVGARKALGDEDVARNVLSLRTGGRWRRWWCGDLGLSEAGKQSGGDDVKRQRISDRHERVGIMYGHLLAFPDVYVACITIWPPGNNSPWMTLSSSARMDLKFR